MNCTCSLIYMYSNNLEIAQSCFEFEFKYGYVGWFSATKTHPMVKDEIEPTRVDGI